MDKITEAEKLYIRENKSIDDIAAALGVAPSTVYRWKNEAKKNGVDWDGKKNLWSLNPAEIEKIYLESVKELIIKIKENPEMMTDSRVADAMCKHIANLKKLNPKNLYLGVALELLDVIDNYFYKNDSAVRESLIVHYESLKEELETYIDRKL